MLSAELGIPTVGIVDIVMYLKKWGTGMSKPLDGAFIPPINQQALHNQRQEILKAFGKTGKDMKKDGGIELLKGQRKEKDAKTYFPNYKATVFLLSKMANKNPGSNPWGAIGHGSNWLIDIFEKMGEDPEKPNYIRPGKGDVWDFYWRNQTMDFKSGKKGRSAFNRKSYLFTYKIKLHKLEKI